MEITASSTELMKQASMTIVEYMDRAKELGITDIKDQLKFAELCAKDFDTSMKCKVFEEFNEIFNVSLGSLHDVLKSISLDQESG